MSWNKSGFTLRNKASSSGDCCIYIKKHSRSISKYQHFKVAVSSSFFHPTSSSFGAITENPSLSRISITSYEQLLFAAQCIIVVYEIHSPVSRKYIYRKSSPHKKNKN